LLKSTHLNPVPGETETVRVGFRGDPIAAIVSGAGWLDKRARAHPFIQDTAARLDPGAGR